jgi:hypothetical protein
MLLGPAENPRQSNTQQGTSMQHQAENSLHNDAINSLVIGTVANIAL